MTQEGIKRGEEGTASRVPSTGFETCEVCGRQYPADLNTAIPVCSRRDCPERGGSA